MEIEEIAAAIIISVVTGVITAWVTVCLALRRFYQENWWRRKLEVYTHTCSSLREIGRIFRLLPEQIKAPTRQPGVEELLKKLDLALKRHLSAVNQLIFFSEEAKRVLHRFEEEGPPVLPRLKEALQSSKGIDHERVEAECLQVVSLCDDIIDRLEKEIKHDLRVVPWHKRVRNWF